MSLQPTPNSAAEQPMSLRQLFRVQVADIITRLSAAQNLEFTVQSPGDWPTPQEKLPAVIVNAPSDQKTSWMRGELAFTTVVDIKVMVRTKMFNTAAEAQNAIDGYSYLIEKAVFTDYAFVRAIQQVVSSSTQSSVSAESNGHIGALTFDFSVEAPEVFDPFVENP